MELKVGRVYRAKKPALADGRYVNDRLIRWIGAYEVQYDGPTVANGRHYPRVTREKFEAWASHDVTDELPANEWQTWESYQQLKKDAKKK